MSRRMVSVKELAKVYGVSQMTVYRMIDRGELDVIHVTARTVRIDSSQLDPVIQELLAEEP